jgi:hypothetical protein
MQQRFGLSLQIPAATLNRVGLRRLAVATAKQENFDVRRRSSFNWIMILGIFAPCLLFWTLVIAALIRLF